MDASRGSKAKRLRKLSREQIIDAALALIQADGVAALSMRSLGRRLGCEPMSLYHHVEGIEGVRDAAVDRLVALTLLGAPDAGEPLDRLEGLARSFLDTARAHPKAFVLVATRLWRTPSTLTALKTVISLFREAGLSGRDALRQARILGAYLNGTGLALAAWGQDDSGPTQRSVASDPELAEVSRFVDEASVRADLDAGLRQFMEAARSCAR